MDDSGTLFVVPTPIGDLADLSPRARRVLGSVACIAAEDTRVTLKLLRGLGIDPPRLVSYHDHNELQRVPSLLARLRGGEDVALVSDAGTPLVSDPGYRIVSAAIEAGVPVVPLPGPCAATTALSASGLAPDRFVVLGFLPRDAAARRALLEQYRREPATLVLYAAPHRVIEDLEAIRDVWGARRVALARNLTKDGEGWVRGPVDDVLSALRSEPDGPRGELTLAVSGASGVAPEDDERVEALVSALIAAGVGVGVVRDVVAAVYDRPRREIYQLALACRDTQEDPR